MFFLEPLTADVGTGVCKKDEPVVVVKVCHLKFPLPPKFNVESLARGIGLRTKRAFWFSWSAASANFAFGGEGGPSPDSYTKGVEARFFFADTGLRSYWLVYFALVIFDKYKGKAKQSQSA